jgi:hypothetical protein
MKRRLKRFNISNKLAYTIIVILFIITLGVGVYAIGSVPNPGHSLSQLQPCDNGQTLIVSGGAWTCTTPSSGGSLTKGTTIYQCPTTPTASNYCASVQLTRNGIGPCIGQLATGVTGCFTVDANCAFTGFGTCTPIGSLVS